MRAFGCGHEPDTAARPARGWRPSGSDVALGNCAGRGRRPAGTNDPDRRTVMRVTHVRKAVITAAALMLLAPVTAVARGGTAENTTQGGTAENTATSRGS